MTTSADEPTRPTQAAPTAGADAPTLKPGALSPAGDVTRATAAPGTAAGRAGMSDTRATIPDLVSRDAPTQIAGSGLLTATAATALDIDGSRPQRAATNAHQGEVWGDFVLGDLLGRGGMGAVYRGRQVSLDRPVAIKVLSEQLSGSDDFRKRFLLEARAAARINSPHVVQVYFAGTHKEIDFFAMEYVEGTDLARKLKDGWHPTPPECLGLILQAVRSLVALGEHKIVHRDIKPANYMLTTAGQLKLMDFGLVRFASESHGLTQTGTVMGTVNYFSPEQGRGEVCDQRTDLYALGVMFYELLTGKLPFTGGDATSVIYQHIHAEPKPPKIHNPAVTEPYQSVVLKCLEKNAADRYQTAAELLGDLERINRGEAPLLTRRTKRAGTADGTATTTTRKLTLAAAVVIAAVILGLAILLRPGTPMAVATVPAATPVVAVEPAPAAVATTPAVTPPATLVAQVPVAPDTPPARPVSTAPAPVPAVIAPAVIVATTPPVKPLPVEPPPTRPIEPPPSAVPAAAPVEAPAVAVLPPPPVAPAKPVEPAISRPVEPPPVAVTVARPVPPPTPAVITPPPPKPIARLAAPAPLSTPVQSTLRIAIPANDELLKATTWLWWLEGPNGRSGRLSARSTQLPEIQWTAPALPTDVTLHVAAIGSERNLTLPLRAVAAAAGAAASLTPFLRAGFADERHVQRLRRDLDGGWWLVDADGATISRNAAGWLTGGRFQPTPLPTRPLAVATTAERIAVLDNDPPSLLVYGRDGSSQRLASGLQRPSDVVALADGSWAIADMRSGGVLVFNQQGMRLRTHVRGANGGWDLLTRLASDGQLLYALDSGTPAIAVFAADPQPLVLWPLDRADKPVALATHAGHVYVLASGGGIRVFDAKGQVVQTLPGAPSALPEEGLGVPGDVTVDATGDIYVTYPEREMIVRHSPDGRQLSLRNARAWTWRAYAADGANRIYTIDAEHHRVVVLDAEGWRQGTLGKAVRQGGTFVTPIALAVHPDGAALAVLDEETRQITRFDLGNGSNLVFGGTGKGDGQFDTPVSLAMDQAGRTYVLDLGLHRVTVFDAQGRFERHFGRFERGDAPDMLRTPRLIAVSCDGGTVFVADDETALIKAFAIDHATNQVRHLGNFGGRGTGPGQLTRATALACDRRGRLYCLDYKRADLQVFDVSTAIPSLVTILRGEPLGIRKMLTLALNPDGIAYIIGGDQMTGLRWQP